MYGYLTALATHMTTSAHDFSQEINFLNFFTPFFLTAQPEPLDDADA